jgi:hypothetical protein
VLTGDTERNGTEGDESGNIRGGKEYAAMRSVVMATLRRPHVQRYRVVLHKGNIQSVLTVKLDVGAGKQFDALFVQSA